MFYLCLSMNRNLCFIHPIFCFWSLLWHYSDQNTKNQKTKIWDERNISQLDIKVLLSQNKAKQVFVLFILGDQRQWSWKFTWWWSANGSRGHHRGSTNGSRGSYWGCWGQSYWWGRHRDGDGLRQPYGVLWKFKRVHSLIDFSVASDLSLVSIL